MNEVSKTFIRVEDCIIEKLRIKLKEFYDLEIGEVEETYQACVSKALSELSLYEQKLDDILFILK